MVDKDKLKVGMTVMVQGKHDREPFAVVILELGSGLMFTHKLLKLNIVSCHKYTDIIKVMGDVK